VIILVDHRK